MTEKKLPWPGYVGEDPGDWLERAICVGHPDPEIFFPPRGSNASSKHGAQAKAVCRECPAMADCLAFALARPYLVGIWGGTTEKQRRQARQN